MVTSFINQNLNLSKISLESAYTTIFLFSKLDLYTKYVSIELIPYSEKIVINFPEGKIFIIKDYVVEFFQLENEYLKIHIKDLNAPEQLNILKKFF